ncbi:MAG TPA: YCF48-related protein [Chitinophagaceae bacterium]|nr:YCF48-related protein [Chitinophagaceae bacterium]
MNSLKTLVTLFLILITFVVSAQQPVITILDSGHKVSLRGLSVVNDDVVWASGSNGTVVRSIDGGKNFEWLTVQGFEKRDFRDIEAFDENTAVIMGVDEPGVILRTTDGGKSWLPVFIDTAKGMFLDAMDFQGRRGVVVGDPLNSYAFIAYTKDGGDTWHKADPLKSNIKLQDGEAFFASSGTNIKLVTDAAMSTNGVLIVTGGTRSRLVTDNGLTELPLLQGSASQGANSIAVMHNHAVVVGGDFAHDTISHDNCVLFNVTDRNFSFTRPKTPPHGYRSCVAFLSKKRLITCGTSGVDISKDQGNNWQLISLQSFHVCQKAKHGSAVFLAGANGKIARLIY